MKKETKLATKTVETKAIELQKITKFLQKHIKADDYNLYVAYDNTQHTRFAQNSITQHIQGEHITVFYSCSIKKKTGTASTRQIDEENLLKTVQLAEENAMNNIPDPDAPTSLPNSKYPEIIGYYPAIKELDTANMINIIKKCITNAENKGAILSGILSKNVSELLFSTGKGFQGYHQSSEAEISMTMRKDHVETKVGYSHKDFNKLNEDKWIIQLNEQFDGLQKMKAMDFEPIAVILRPQAVRELFMYLRWYFNRKMADEGLTPFTGQLNKKFLGSKFSLKSVLNDPDLSNSPFSPNGIRTDITWVEKGKLLNLPTSREWAQKHKLEPTDMYNVVMDGEGTSEKEMMKMVKRGIIVNNLWYIRMNDMKTFDLTGMTRDGVMYFENGKILHAVNNFRFNEPLHELTHRILTTGVSTQIDINHKVPTMLIDKFNLVDKTTF